MEEWKEKLKMQRKNKGKFFEQNPRSPIPLKDRRDFDGIDYFPVDSKYRFELKFNEHDEKKKIEVEDNQGGIQKYIRWGEFRFSIDGEDVKLQAYKSKQNEKRLWAPFRDETNGEKTYAAGRYLDLEPAEHREDGKWIIDFNEAYNPYCAYSEDYVCPFIPPENWLEVPVEAGEKDYEED